MRCSTSSSQAGHINFRLWASNDPNGQTGVREITSGSVVCSTVTLATTTTTYTSTATPSLPSFTVNGDYLFIQVEWVETVASGSNNGNVLFYQSACTVVTADFQPIIIGAEAATDLIDTSSVAGSVAWPAATATLAASDPIDGAATAGAVFTPVTATLGASDPLDASSMAGTVANAGLSGTLAASDPVDTTNTPGVPASTSLLHVDTGIGDAISPHTWTLIQSSGANCYVDSTQSKFGGASLYCDGSTGTGILSDCTQDYAFGTGDFTLDFWARPQQNTLVYLISWQAVGDSTENLDIGFYDQGNWYFYTAQNATKQFAPVTYGVWQHIAICRQAGVVYCFKDGVLYPNNPGFTFADTFNIYVNSTTAPLIGQSRVGQGSSYLGNIDEIRFLKGTAVWTSNFTPPTSPYSATAVPGTTTFNGQVYWSAALAATEPTDTGTVAGRADPIGSLAATDIIDTSAIAATVAWQGTLATTDHPDTSAIAALAAAFGTLAATDLIDTSSIAGASVSSGALAATDIIDKAAITAQLVSSGTLAASDPLDAALVAAQLISSGTLAATDPADTSAIVASIPLPVSGTLAATDVIDAAAILAAIVATGALTTTDLIDRAAVAGQIVWSVSLAATEPTDVAGFSGAASWLATLSTSDAVDHAALSGTVFSALSGTLAATDLIDTAAMAVTVFSGVTAVLAATDPRDSVPAAENMLASYTPGNTRGGAFWVGGFVIPNTDQTVTSIGCLAGNGNSGTTTVTLVDQATGTILADTTVNMSAPQANGFCYGPITPTIVSAGKTYVIAANSAPMAGWSDVNGSFATYGPDFTGNGGCYNSSEGGVYTAAGGWPYWQYVGVDLIYGTPGFSGAVTGIAGTLAASDLVDHAVLAGAVITTGTLAAQDAIDVAVVAGGIYATGVLAATETQDSAALAGGIFATGTLSASEPRDGAAAAAIVAWSATLAANDNPDHAVFSGVVVSAGALGAVEISDLATGAGEVISSGTLDASEPLDQSLISGTVHAANVVVAIPGDPVATPPDRTVTPTGGDRTVAPPVAARAAVATNGGRISGGTAPSRVVSGSPPTRRAA